MSIKIIFADHLPKHIHIFVGSDETKVEFKGTIMSGSLEAHKLKKVRKWLIKRRKELNVQWVNAMNKAPIERIKP